MSQNEVELKKGTFPAELSMLVPNTHTNLRGRLKWPSGVTSLTSPLHVRPRLWSCDLQVEITWCHTWHRMSLPRPDIVKQHSTHVQCWNRHAKRNSHSHSVSAHSHHLLPCGLASPPCQQSRRHLQADNICTAKRCSCCNVITFHRRSSWPLTQEPFAEFKLAGYYHFALKYNSSGLTTFALL